MHIGARNTTCNSRVTVCRSVFAEHITPQEAGMPRGDELREEYRFSDRDDDVDDLGYGGGGGGGGGGGSSYDGDDEEDGGWMTHKDDSDDLWDSTDDVDEEDDEGGAAAPGLEAGEE